MEHRKHVMFFRAVLLFYLSLHLLPVNSEHLRNSSNTDKARKVVLASSAVVVVSVNRRGGSSGGHGSGHAGGGHESSAGMHGNGDNGNSPHTLAGGAIPLYAGANHHNNYNHHHGTSDGILNYVSFYHYLLSFISIAILL